MFHPASLLLLWGAGLFVFQVMTAYALWAASFLVVVIAAAYDFPTLVRMTRRSRWLFLSMAVLFVFFSPGIRLAGIFAPLGTLGVTADGLDAARDHCLRLLAMLAMVVILLHWVGREGLVLALVALMKPLHCLGFNTRAAAVRLSLALEEVSQRPSGSWRDYLQSPAGDERAVMQLPAVHWAWRDAVLLVAGLAMIVLLCEVIR